jgi:hypothetical protein
MVVIVMFDLPSEPRGTTRTKNETKEEKKSRKQAVKDERQVCLMLCSCSLNLTSLAILDPPYREEGDEGDVLWGAQAATATAGGETNANA